MALKCRGCGWPTEHACPGGCSWVSIDPPICSACQPADDACPGSASGLHDPLWLTGRTGLCLGCRALMIVCEAA